MTNKLLLALGATLLLVQAGCTGEASEVSHQPACENGIVMGDRELRQKRVNGVGDVVKWSKAASLLAAARAQETFEEYQNCMIKVREARAYIRTIQ